jgi:hypothetical protein
MARKRQNDEREVPPNPLKSLRNFATFCPPHCFSPKRIVPSGNKHRLLERPSKRQKRSDTLCCRWIRVFPCPILCCALFPGDSLASSGLLDFRCGPTGKCEGDMSGRACALMVILVSGLALTACGSDAISLGDAAPIPADAVPLPRPAPKPSVAAAAAPTLPNWRHVPDPVSAAQFNQDKAICSKLAHNSPGVGSPELKFYFAFTDCMHSVGYEATSSL